MEKFFKINSMDLKINSQLLLASFSMDFQESICLLGESGSGKSKLLQSLKEHSNYETNGKVVFYLGEKVNVSNWMECICYSSLPTIYQSFCDSLFINKKNIEMKCAFVLKLLEEPDFFFSDDLPFTYFEISLICSFLCENKIRFFLATNDVEKAVFFLYLYVLKNNQVAIEGKTLLVLKEEKLMKILGFSLPFYINMSIQLGYYGLLHDIYLNKEDMEVALWQSK